MYAERGATFERLVAEHHGRVLRVCRSILRDEHLGADAAQETFLRLWKEVRAGREPRQFAAWLAQVATRTSLDFLRRAGARARVEEREERRSEPEPAALLERTEIERRFERALAGLSEGQRAVFLLRHSGGLTLRAAADSLGLALPTAKTQFARACLKLQAALKDYETGKDDQR
jgi:RNA polymerase sigma-70 factor (ECF subfamily)